MFAPPAPRSRGRSGSTGPDAAEPSVSVLEQVFSRRGEAPLDGSLGETQVATWAGTVGTLVDGRMAHLAASCLMRPCAGDRVLVWLAASRQGGRAALAAEGWIVAIIERASNATSVLASATPLAIETPCLGVSAGAVHIAARDFLTSTRNRHAVEDTRTETARVRVAEVGTDIRRATTVDDQVAGTLLQRAGTWIANTAREARFKARTFLFD